MSLLFYCFFVRQLRVFFIRSGSALWHRAWHRSHVTVSYRSSPAYSSYITPFEREKDGRQKSVMTLVVKVVFASAATSTHFFVRNFRHPLHPHRSAPQMASIDNDALLALYHATRVPEWENNWDTETDISLWHGVTVNEGRVVELELSSNNLQGILSTNLSCDVLYLRQECVDRKWPFHKIASFTTAHNIVFLVRSRVLHTVYT